jgi:transcriptional regulator with XRE-family HTH domain
MLLELLNKLINQSGLSQTDLANKVGLSQSKVSRVLSGQTRLTPCELTSTINKTDLTPHERTQIYLNYCYECPVCKTMFPGLKLTDISPTFKPSRIMRHLQDHVNALRDYLDVMESDPNPDVLKDVKIGRAHV